ncbi:MAG: chromosome segregation protein SMC, partial [Synergistales bacterium]|nr:chromosome segregation protein SMC [Synergistales bacterium]
MYISHLRLKGFKSFGGIHELEISPGYTAIVGPNGSGKSNILDAIRWVLGDSSINRLRISRQSDLSFQGSISLKPANEVEVVMTIDDPRKLSTISRYYHNESGTTVMVDGTRIRLSDLELIKREWKLGADQSGFISQGEIADTIRQKGFQRRLQLEILFGIDQYRKNREEADIKLKDTTDELIRLRTLLSELISRQSEIEPEVARAEKAKILENRLSVARKEYYFKKRLEVESDIHGIDKRLDMVNENLAKRHIWVNIWANSVHDTKEKLAFLTNRIQNLESDERKLSGERDNYLKQSFSLANSRKACLERRNSYFIELEKKEEEISLIVKDLKETIQTGKGLCAEVERMKKNLNQRERTLSELQEKIKEEVVLRTKLVKELADLDLKGTNQRRQIIADIRQIKDSKLTYSRLIDLFGQLEEEIRSGGNLLQTKEAELIHVVEEHKRSYSSCQSLALQMQQLRRETSLLESRYEQSKIATEDDVYPEGVRFLLSASRLGRSCVVVPVVETFQAAPELSTALDAYLGGRVFWLVIGSLKEARTCIDMLKSHEKGRVTFLPLDNCRPRKTPGVQINGEGTLGWAIKLLEVIPAYRKAIEHLLGDLLIVRTFDNARYYVDKRCSFPVVTLEGDVFAPSGTVTGGKNRKGPGLIERRQERDKIRKQLEETGSRLAEIKERLSLEEKQEQHFSRLKEEISLQLNSLEKEKKAREIEYVDLDKRISITKDGIRKHMEEISSLLRARNDRIHRKRFLDQQLTEVSDQQDIDILKEELSDIYNTLSIKQEKLNSNGQIQQRITEELHRTNDAREKIAKEMDVLLHEVEQHDLRLKELGVASYSKWLQIKGIEQEKGVLSESLAGLKKSVNRQEFRYQLAREALTSLQTSRDIMEQQKRSVTNELEQLIDTWNSQYSYEVLDVSEEGYGDLDNLSGEIRKLEREIKRLGDYNPGALSENLSLKERISFLKEQIMDVESGLDELKGIIENADNQVDRVFRHALKNIDLRFNSLFKRLFGGGEARLELGNNST